MIRKIKYLFLFLLSLPVVPGILFAQSVSPAVIGSAGEYVYNGAFGSLSSTVGESAVQTVSSGSVTLTQGFQQVYAACPASVGNLTISPNDSICPGASATITPSINPPSGSYTYYWSSGQTTSSIVVAPTITTAYTFSLVGCTASTVKTATVVVVPVSAMIVVPNSNSPVCAGQTLSLTAGNASGAVSYSWSGPNGFTSTLQNPTIPNVTTAAGGTYSVTAINSFGCSGTVGTTPVIVNPLPGPPVAGSNSPICAGQTLSLTASSMSGATYAWAGPNGFTSTVQNPTITVTNTANAGTYSVTVTMSSCPSPAGTTTVIINPIPPAPNASSNSSICAGKTLSLTATTVTNATYSWAGPNSFTSSLQNPVIPNAFPVASGNYTVVAIVAGCTSTIRTTSVVVAPSPNPSISVAPSTTICVGETITLTASGGNLYSWNTGATSASIVQVPAAGVNYSVLATAPNGCANTASVAITVNTLPTAVINGNKNICSGQNTTLTASGGTSYVWNPGGQTTAVITPAPTASTGYTVTAVNSSGCKDTASIFISVTTTPVAIISASDSSVCKGTAVTLNASGGNSYSWHNTGQTIAVITVTPSTSTTYTVTVSNGSCSSTTSLQVSVASVSVTITGNTTICRGNAATLAASTSGTAGNTYSWNTGATSSSIIVSPTTGTGYTVTVTNGTSGCSDTKTVFVTVNAAPTASISGATTICLFQKDTLIASGGNTYLWNIGVTTSMLVIQPIVTGNVTYSVTVSNGNCSSTASVTITVKPLPFVTASASDSTICLGDQITLNATGGIAYSWANLGLTNPVIITPTASATYSVGGLGANGCYNYATVTVSLSSISVNAGIDQTICPGFTAHLQANASGDTTGQNFWWHPGSTLNDSMISNPSANPDSTTTYFLEVFNTEGCWGKDTVTVFVTVSPTCSIHVYNGITPNGDGDNDIWWIDGIKSFPDNSVHIFNRWGNKVWFGAGYDNNQVKWRGRNMNEEMLPSGTYYYVIDIKMKDKTETLSGWVEITR